MYINHQFPKNLFSLLFAVIVTHVAAYAANTVSWSNAPVSLTKGQTYQLTANYESNGSGIVQVQLLDSSWNSVTSEWRNVSSGSGTESFDLAIPSSAASGTGYRWQALLYTPLWVKKDEEVVSPVSVSSSSGPSIVLNAPSTVTAGSSQTVSANYNLSGGGIVQVQFLDSSWNPVASEWRSVSASSGSESFTLVIPSSTSVGGGYLWQALLYDSLWDKKNEEVYGNVTVQSGQGGEWLPSGSWQLEWSDEFSGTGQPTAWHPMLGYTPGDYQNNNEKGLRWNGPTENTSQMYSTRTGNHWLNGQGQLVIRAICDKTSSNANGNKVKTAYLQTGFPKEWDSSEPTGVKWDGVFVSPKNGPLYISARVRTDKVVGYSTWFAFWLFSQTRAYNGNPTDGTEVDMIEIAKGAPSYMNKSFNVAHHWAQSGGSESSQFSTGTNPSSTSFVDVTDSNYHTYGIEWTQNYMKCSVDGQVYYTFTNNIPTDPVDMMLMLTMEFQKNAWDPNQGDGRTAGPYVSDNSTVREMSRVLIDHVRVYRKQ